MKKVLLLPIIFALFLIPALAQNNVVFNQEQAVAVAEKFVAKNGYTDKTPIEKKKLFLERGEKISDINKIISTRYNLIESQPVIALIKDAGGQSVWSVQFLFIKQDYKKQEQLKQIGFNKVVVAYDFGREVRMSLDGSKVWMERNPIAVTEARIFGDCTGENEKDESAEKP
jgi:hypothetical protein